MPDDLIFQAAKLMQEQTAAYQRLNSACTQLATALVAGSPETVDSLTNAGETELLRMRSRLVQIMSTLTVFAEARSMAINSSPISAEARATFETASRDLAEAAREFQRTHQRAASLALSGASLASASIEMCGFQPMTYRAPYARQGEKAWA